MVAAFAPIEAVATQRTARLRDVCGKEAEFAEQRPAGIAHTQATASVHERSACLQAIIDQHAKLAGQMIVAQSRLTKSWIDRAEYLCGRGELRQSHHSLQ